MLMIFVFIWCLQVNGKKKGVLEVPSNVTDLTGEIKAAALQYAKEKGLLSTTHNTQDLMDSTIVASTGLLVNIVLKSR